MPEASWPRCLRCHAPRGTGRDPSPDCLECRDWPPELTRACYAWLLRPPATDLVHGLKYEGWRELAGTMGRAMARAMGTRLDVDGLSLVVPVPTTPRRIRERGYNQARLLAEVVASCLGLPLGEALHRGSASSSQTTLSPRDRRENVRDAFRAVDGPESLEGHDVLLVDDVLTTGATAGEAARTLASAGAASIHLLTFARALQGSTGGRGSRPAA
jgi:ComF family protein